MVYTCKQVPLSSYYALLYIKLKCIFKSIRNWEYNFFIVHVYIFNIKLKSLQTFSVEQI